VNPHDADELADALDAALNMSLAERQSRWQASWDALKDTSALAWGRSFVAALLRAAVAGPVGERRAATAAVPLPDVVGPAGDEIGLMRLR